MNFLKLEDIESYRISYDLSNYVWDIVVKWDNFAKYSIGQQFVNAMDSVSANITEGFGRYHKKDKIRFYRISQGSLSETKDHTSKAVVRNLLTKEEENHILLELDKLPLAINQLTKFTSEKLKF